MNSEPLQPRETPNPTDTLFFFRLVWFALFLSVTILFVPFYLRDPAGFSLHLAAGEFVERFRTRENPAYQVLTVIGFGNAVVAFLLSKLVAKIAVGKFLTVPGDRRAFRGVTREEIATVPLRIFFAPFLIRLAILHSVAIVGFALGYVIGGALTDFLPFILLAQLGFIRSFPLSAEKMRRDFGTVHSP